MIKREEDLSSCRFAEVTLRLRGRIPYEPEEKRKVAKCP